MKNPALVGIVNGARKNLNELGRRAKRQRHAAHQLAQAASINVLQGTISALLGMLAHFINLNDVGMLQPGHGFPFGAKPRQLARVRLGPGAEELEGHQPRGLELPGLVHHPHAAASQYGQDFVTVHLRQGKRTGRLFSIQPAGRQPGPGRGKGGSGML